MLSPTPFLMFKVKGEPCIRSLKYVAYLMATNMIYSQRSWARVVGCKLWLDNCCFFTSTATTTAPVTNTAIFIFTITYSTLQLIVLLILLLKLQPTSVLLGPNICILNGELFFHYPFKVHKRNSTQTEPLSFFDLAEQYKVLLFLHCVYGTVSTCVCLSMYSIYTGYSTEGIK